MRTMILMAAAALVLVVAAPSNLSAQTAGHPQVEAVAVPTEVVPATVGDEGPLRYAARPPADRSSYKPRTPVYEPRAAPKTPSLPVMYDAASGVESVLPLPVGPFPSMGSVAGRSFAAAVDEQGYQTLFTPMAVTADLHPWRVHARMWFSDSGGGNWVCSGTMVDPKTMLTAGHCVHEGPGGTWMSNVVISTGWDGDDDDCGSAAGTQLGTWTAWTDSGSWDWDQGYVRLDRPIGFLSSWLGYGYNDDDNWWSTTTFNDIGWPAGCFAGAPDQLYYAWGTWDYVWDNVVASDVSWPCWMGGMSGGGIYYLEGDSRWAYANNSHGGGKPVETNYVGVCRINSTKFLHMRDSWIPDSYSTTDPDYVPLRVTAGDTQAGQGIPGMSYLVVNASYYNPIGTLVYPVDVYLSTNDNISEFDTLIEHHTFSWNFDAMSTVNVNMGAPIVPADTAPGTYWTGVIMDVADWNISNNDTDGWDAAQIEVEPLCDNTAWKWTGGVSKPGWFGSPTLDALEYPVVPMPDWTLFVSNSYPFITGYLIIGLTYFNAPFDGGRMYPHPDLIVTFPVDASGNAYLSMAFPADPNYCGVNIWWQCMFPNDPGASGWRQTSQTNYVGTTFGK